MSYGQKEIHSFIKYRLSTHCLPTNPKATYNHSGAQQVSLRQMALSTLTRVRKNRHKAQASLRPACHRRLEAAAEPMESGKPELTASH